MKKYAFLIGIIACIAFVVIGFVVHRNIANECIPSACSGSGNFRMCTSDCGGDRSFTGSYILFAFAVLALIVPFLTLWKKK